MDSRKRDSSDPPCGNQGSLEHSDSWNYEDNSDPPPNNEDNSDPPYRSQDHLESSDLSPGKQDCSDPPSRSQDSPESSVPLLGNQDSSDLLSSNEVSLNPLYKNEESADPSSKDQDCPESSNPLSEPQDDFADSLSVNKGSPNLLSGNQDSSDILSGSQDSLNHTSKNQDTSDKADESDSEKSVVEKSKSEKYFDHDAALRAVDSCMEGYLCALLTRNPQDIMQSQSAFIQMLDRRLEKMENVVMKVFHTDPDKYFVLAMECHFVRAAKVILASSKVVNPDRFIFGKNKPLHVAVLCDDAELVELLVKCGSSVHRLSYQDLLTPLQLACGHNKLAAATALLNLGSDCNGPLLDKLHRFTPLHMAVLSDNIEMVRLLLEHGASPNARSTEGHTPLALAVMMNKIKVASAWISGTSGLPGGMEFCIDKNNNSLLHLAAENSEMLVELLVKHLPDLAFPKGDFPMLYPEQLLRQTGAHVQPSQQETGLVEEKIRKMLALKNHHHMTALHVSIAKGKVSSTDTLITAYLDAGLDLKSDNGFFQCALDSLLCSENTVNTIHSLLHQAPSYKCPIEIIGEHKTLHRNIFSLTQPLQASLTSMMSRDGPIFLEAESTECPACSAGSMVRLLIQRHVEVENEDNRVEKIRQCVELSLFQEATMLIEMSGSLPSILSLQALDYPPGDWVLEEMGEEKPRKSGPSHFLPVPDSWTMPQYYWVPTNKGARQKVPSYFVGKRKSCGDNSPSVRTLIGMRCDFTILHQVCLQQKRPCEHSDAEFKRQQLRCLEALLERGLAADLGNKLGQSPLHLALLADNSFLVDTLCRYGADTNAVDVFSSTPLYIACRKSDVDTFQLLIKNGADVNYVFQSVQTVLENRFPWIRRPARDYDSSSQWMLHYVYNVWLHKSRANCAPLPLLNPLAGATLLHISIANKSLHFVKLLVHNKADLGAKNGQGMTPLQSAIAELLNTGCHQRHHSMMRIVSYLVEVGSPFPDQQLVDAKRREQLGRRPTIEPPTESLGWTILYIRQHCGQLQTAERDGRYFYCHLLCLARQAYLSSAVYYLDSVGWPVSQETPVEVTLSRHGVPSKTLLFNWIHLPITLIPGEDLTLDTLNSYLVLRQANPLTLQNTARLAIRRQLSAVRTSTAPPQPVDPYAGRSGHTVQGRNSVQVFISNPVHPISCSSPRVVVTEIESAIEQLPLASKMKDFLLFRDRDYSDGEEAFAHLSHLLPHDHWQTADKAFPIPLLSPLSSPSDDLARHQQDDLTAFQIVMLATPSSIALTRPCHSGPHEFERLARIHLNCLLT